MSWCCVAQRLYNMVAKGFSAVWHFRNQATTFELIMEDGCLSLLDSVLITFLDLGVNFTLQAGWSWGAAGKNKLYTTAFNQLGFQNCVPPLHLHSSVDCRWDTITCQLTTNESPNRFAWGELNKTMICSWSSDQDEIVMEVQENLVACTPLQHPPLCWLKFERISSNQRRVPTTKLN